MNREIICSLLSVYAGAVSIPAHANDNAVVALCRTGTDARGLADHYVDQGTFHALRARPIRSCKDSFVPAAERSACTLPAIRLLIARPR